MGIRQIDLVEEVTKIKSLESSLTDCFHCVEDLSFDSRVGKKILRDILIFFFPCLPLCGGEIKSCVKLFALNQ